MLWFNRKAKAKVEVPLALSAVYVCETGCVRKDNQDNVLASFGHGVFCVSDGIGGGQEGAKASAIVCKELNLMMRVAGAEFAQRMSAARSGLVDANATINAYAVDRGYSQMGATAVALVFDLAGFHRAAVIHAGDSRAYRIRRGLGEALTRDHRVAGGTMLTRAVGPCPRLECDLREVDVERGDRFVLCTDGVHGVVSDTRIAALVGAGSIESAAERLAAAVVKAGAPDNYSFVIVEAS